MRHKEFGRLAIFALQIEIMFILFIPKSLFIL